LATTCWLFDALWLAGTSSAPAQRRIRIGPTYSSLALDDGSGSSHSFSSFGGSAALITGDDGEAGLSIARYNDLSTDKGIRRLSLFALDSYYYPVGTRAVVAPFSLTTVGLARVTEVDSLCVLSLIACSPAPTPSHLALAFGLGVRVNVGSAAVATVAGRFLEVPGSQIQALEALANASIAFGAVRKGEFLEGTVGPAASFLVPISGTLRARAPVVGARFRRETKKAGTLGLQIDFAPLKITAACPPTGCEENAILFAPGYERSVRSAWGRLYGEAGLPVPGVYSQGSERGLAQGAHGGLGAVLYLGRAVLKLMARPACLPRKSGENVFGVQVGVSVSPRIGRR